MKHVIQSRRSLVQIKEMRRQCLVTARALARKPNWISFTVRKTLLSCDKDPILVQINSDQIKQWKWCLVARSNWSIKRACTHAAADMDQKLMWFLTLQVELMEVTCDINKTMPFKMHYIISSFTCNISDPALSCLIPTQTWIHFTPKTANECNRSFRSQERSGPRC